MASHRLEEDLSYSDMDADDATSSTETVTDGTRAYTGSLFEDDCVELHPNEQFDLPGDSPCISQHDFLVEKVDTTKINTSPEKSTNVVLMTDKGKALLHKASFSPTAQRFDALEAKILSISQRQNEQFQIILEKIAGQKRQGVGFSPPRDSKRVRYSSSTMPRETAGDDTGCYSKGDGHQAYRESGTAGSPVVGRHHNPAATIVRPSDMRPAQQVVTVGDVNPDIQALMDDCPQDESDAILNELFPPKQGVVKGPKLHDKVASLVNQKWLTRLKHEEIKAMGDLVIPSNVTAVLTPSLNSEIWVNLDPNTRKIELRNMQLQENLQRVAVTAAKSFETFLSLEKDSRSGDGKGNPLYQQLLHENMNSVSLLGMASSHISFMRRQRLKSVLGDKISGICDLQYEGPHNHLFGDDLNATIARADEKRKVAETITKKKPDFRQGSYRKKPPYNPQPNTQQQQQQDTRSKRQKWWEKNPQSTRQPYRPKKPSSNNSGRNVKKPPKEKQD